MHPRMLFFMQDPSGAGYLKKLGTTHAAQFFGPSFLVQVSHGNEHSEQADPERTEL